MMARNRGRGSRVIAFWPEILAAVVGTTPVIVYAVAGLLPHPVRRPRFEQNTRRPRTPRWELRSEHPRTCTCPIRAPSGGSGDRPRA